MVNGELLTDLADEFSAFLISFDEDFEEPSSLLQDKVFTGVETDEEIGDELDGLYDLFDSIGNEIDYGCEDQQEISSGIEALMRNPFRKRLIAYIILNRGLLEFTEDQIDEDPLKCALEAETLLIEALESFKENFLN